MAENNRPENTERQVTTPSERVENTNVLNEVNPDRDEVFKAKRQEMKATGEHFSMSKIEPGQENSGSKFELVDSSAQPDTPVRKESFADRRLNDPVQRLKELRDQ